MLRHQQINIKINCENAHKTETRFWWWETTEFLHNKSTDITPSVTQAMRYHLLLLLVLFLRSMQSHMRCNDVSNPLVLVDHKGSDIIGCRSLQIFVVPEACAPLFCMYELRLASSPGNWDWSYAFVAKHQSQRTGSRGGWWSTKVNDGWRIFLHIFCSFMIARPHQASRIGGSWVLAANDILVAFRGRFNREHHAKEQPMITCCTTRSAGGFPFILGWLLSCAVAVRIKSTLMLLFDGSGTLKRQRTFTCSCYLELVIYATSWTCFGLVESVSSIVRQLHAGKGLVVFWTKRRATDHSVSYV